MTGFAQETATAERTTAVVDTHQGAAVDSDLPSMALIRQALAPSSARKQSLRDSYEERLRTFSPATYFAKPHSLSPLLCARLGFENVGTNMLQCSGCKAALEIEIPASLSVHARFDLTRQLEDQLAAVHGEACPFRHDAEIYLKQSPRNKDDGDELVVPMLLAQVWPTEIMDLVETPRPLSVVHHQWKRILECIPSSVLLELEVPNVLLEFNKESYPDLLSHLVGIVRNQRGNGDSNNNEKVEKAALVLVFFGWIPNHDSETSMFHCQCPVCGSRLCPTPSTNSAVDEDDTTATTDDDNLETAQPRAKRARTGDTTASCMNNNTNPLQGHRHYCPFVCGFPRRGEANATPLWQSVINRLLQQQQQQQIQSENQSSNAPQADHVGQQGKTPAACRLEVRKILQSGLLPIGRKGKPPAKKT